MPPRADGYGPHRMHHPRSHAHYSHHGGSLAPPSGERYDPYHRHERKRSFQDDAPEGYERGGPAAGYASSRWSGAYPPARGGAPGAYPPVEPYSNSRTWTASRSGGFAALPAGGAPAPSGYARDHASTKDVPPDYGRLRSGFPTAAPPAPPPGYPSPGTRPWPAERDRERPLEGERDEIPPPPPPVPHANPVPTASAAAPSYGATSSPPAP